MTIGARGIGWARRALLLTAGLLFLGTAAATWGTARFAARTEVVLALVVAVRAQPGGSVHGSERMLIPTFRFTTREGRVVEVEAEAEASWVWSVGIMDAMRYAAGPPVVLVRDDPMEPWAWGIGGLLAGGLALVGGLVLPWVGRRFASLRG